MDRPAAHSTTNLNSSPADSFSGRGSSGIVVTPQAVVIDLDTGGIASRLLEGLIDAMVRVGILFVGALVLTGSGAQHAVIAVSVLVFFVVIGYPILCETLLRGRTIGKMATGLRVVTTDGAPISFRHAALRGMGSLVDFFIPGFGLTGLVCVWATQRNQRVGDMLAGTIVVRDRSFEYAANAFWFSAPLGFERYAETIDPTSMRVDDYAIVRSFLLRAGLFTPSARSALGSTVASGLAARLGHSIPPQVAPETFLVCAIARYQRRNHAAGQMGYR